MSSVPAELRSAIARVRPELGDAPMVLHTAGWDSDAVEAGGSIFKFPKGEAAMTRLRREASFLALVASRVLLRVPRMRLHQRPIIFSEHEKIPGEKLETPQYDRLSDAQRQTLAETLGRFYAALHEIPLDTARAAGAEPIPGWPAAAEILRVAEAKLPVPLHGYAFRVLAAYAGLPQDDLVFGYFDGHGWNMAFDHQAGVLNGVYDFADAGLGPRSRDLCYSSFVSPDLTMRLIDAYERAAGRSICRRIVALHTAVQRLAELALAEGDERWFIDNVLAWHDVMEADPGLRV